MRFPTQLLIHSPLSANQRAAGGASPAAPLRRGVWFCSGGLWVRVPPPAVRCRWGVRGNRVISAGFELSHGYPSCLSGSGIAPRDALLESPAGCRREPHSRRVPGSPFPTCSRFPRAPFPTFSPCPGAAKSLRVPSELTMSYKFQMWERWKSLGGFFPPFLFGIPRG